MAFLRVIVVIGRGKTWERSSLTRGAWAQNCACWPEAIKLAVGQSEQGANFMWLWTSAIPQLRSTKAIQKMARCPYLSGKAVKIIRTLSSDGCLRKEGWILDGFHVHWYWWRDSSDWDDSQPQIKQGALLSNIKTPCRACFWRSFGAPTIIFKRGT